MVVDDPDRLHERVRRGGADEAKAALFELLRQGLRFRRRGRDVAAGPRRALAIGAERPGEGRERLVTGGQVAGGGGVGDRGLDLGPVANDPGVGEQALDLGLAVVGDALVVEPVERLPEVLALAQDRQPREPGLKRLQGQPLVDAPVVGDRPAPLGVVVGDVVGARDAPRAAAQAVVAAGEPAHAGGGKLSRGRWGTVSPAPSTSLIVRRERPRRADFAIGTRTVCEPTWTRDLRRGPTRSPFWRRVAWTFSGSAVSTAIRRLAGPGRDAPP